MGKKSILYDIPKDELQKICDNSPSLRQVCLQLNVHNETLIKVCEERNIDLSKLHSNRHIKYDLTGQKFGRLTVLEIDDKKKSREIYWKCQCSCGNKKILSISTDALRHGHSTSCGCKRIENARKARKKYCNYDLSKDYGIGYTTNNNTPFYFDKEDYDKLKDYAWTNDNNGYIQTSINKKYMLLHRMIMNCDKGLEVDHINHKVFDNRKCNLRICTRKENASNKLVPINNSSGCKGVRQIPSTQKWNARIKVDGKEIFLGNYETYEDAVKARENAEIKYFGEFRYIGDSDVYD